MIPGIDEMLLAHARQNGLRRLDIGVSEYIYQPAFIATGWWNAIDGELRCAIGLGETVTAAFGQMLDDADATRAQAQEVAA